MCILVCVCGKELFGAGYYSLACNTNKFPHLDMISSHTDIRVQTLHTF